MTITFVDASYAYIYLSIDMDPFVSMGIEDRDHIDVEPKMISSTYSFKNQNVVGHQG